MLTSQLHLRGHMEAGTSPHASLHSVRPAVYLAAGSSDDWDVDKGGNR